MADISEILNKRKAAVQKTAKSKAEKRRPDENIGIAAALLSEVDLEPKLIPYSWLSVSSFNTYHVNEEEVTELAESIRSLGLMDYPVVEKSGEEQYEILSGQKRFLAIGKIRKSFPDQYKRLFVNDKIPCKVMSIEDFKIQSSDGHNRLSDNMVRTWLVAAGNQQHEKTVQDYMLQVTQLSDVYTELKAKGMISPGEKQRSFIAGNMDLQERSIQKVLTAKKHILPDLWKRLLTVNDLVSISMLDGIASLPVKVQEILLSEYENGRAVNLEEYLYPEKTHKKNEEKEELNQEQEMFYTKEQIRQIFDFSRLTKIASSVPNDVQISGQDALKLELINQKLQRLKQDAEKVLTKYR